MKIMMLTAGEGTRLRPHTSVLPKPAISFLNVPLFLHALRFLEEVNPTQVVFNTFHLPQRLKTVVKEYTYLFDYQFSDEQVLLGSGGGLGKARNFFQQEDTFILMNGDELILPELSGQLIKALDFHRSQKNIATLLVTENSEVGKKFGGVWVDQKNVIKGFGKEKAKGSEKGFHYIGVGIFSKEIFNFIPTEGESNILYDNLMKSFAQGYKASVFPLNCHWFETGNEADFKTATWQCLDEIDKKTNQGKFILETIKRYSPDSYFESNSSGFFLKNRRANLNHVVLKNYGVFSSGTQCGEGITLDRVICCSKDVRITHDLTNKIVLE